MDYAERVRFGEHVADFRGDSDGTFGRESAVARERLGEGRAFDVLHDDEGATVGEVAGVEDHGGARVFESRHRPRLAHEALGDFAVCGELLF